MLNRKCTQSNCNFISRISSNGILHRDDQIPVISVNGACKLNILIVKQTHPSAQFKYTNYDEILLGPKMHLQPLRNTSLNLLMLQPLESCRLSALSANGSAGPLHGPRYCHPEARAFGILQMGIKQPSTCSEVNVKILIELIAKIANFHTVLIANLQGLLYASILLCNTASFLTGYVEKPNKVVKTLQTLGQQRFPFLACFLASA